MQWLLWLKGALLVTIKYLLLPLSAVIPTIFALAGLTAWGLYFFSTVVGQAVQIVLDFGWDRIPFWCS